MRSASRRPRVDQNARCVQSARQMGGHGSEVSEFLPATSPASAGMANGGILAIALRIKAFRGIPDGGLELVPLLAGSQSPAFFPSGFIL